jgi:hypothetical protein
MRANNLMSEETAEDFNLPVEQVLEAQAYYQTYAELIASEIAQETLSLMEQGVELEPIPLVERRVGQPCPITPITEQERPCRFLPLRPCSRIIRLCENLKAIRSQRGD